MFEISTSKRLLVVTVNSIKLVINSVLIKKKRFFIAHTRPGRRPRFECSLTARVYPGRSIEEVQLDRLHFVQYLLFDDTVN